MRDGLTYQGNDHREVIEQLFKINDILPNMCERGSKFDAEDFHRNIIVATLHEKARVEYIKRGGRNLRDKDDILDLLEEIQDGIDAEMQFKHKAQPQPSLYKFQRGFQQLRLVNSILVQLGIALA